MVKFPTFRLGGTDKGIMDKLTAMEHHFVTRAQFDLFKMAAEDLTRRRRKKDIQAVVTDYSRRVEALGKIVIADSTTHRIVDEQVQILRDGLAKLNSIRPGTCSRADEEAAIMKDTAQFQKYVGMLQKPSQTSSVLVYDMVNPGAAPIALPSSFSKCKQVRRYLHIKQLAYRPELWTRYQDPIRQRHTPSGLMWEWLPQDGDVQGKHLEFVSRQEGVSAGDYIVVLKYIKDQDPEELPEPLDLAPLGSPCCSSKCGNLQAHLKKIWPEHLVVHALKIQDGTDVLGETFDDNLFDPRTNSLYVHLE